MDEHLPAESWYAEKHGVRLGPLSFDTLRTWIREGTLRPTDLVCSSRSEDWHEVQSISALFDVDTTVIDQLNMEARTGSSNGKPDQKVYDSVSLGTSASATRSLDVNSEPGILSAVPKNPRPERPYIIITDEAHTALKTLRPSDTTGERLPDGTWEYPVDQELLAELHRRQRPQRGESWLRPQPTFSELILRMTHEKEEEATSGKTTRKAEHKESLTSVDGFRAHQQRQRRKKGWMGMAVIIGVCAIVVLYDEFVARGSVLSDDIYCSIGAGRVQTVPGRIEPKAWSANNGCGAYMPECVTKLEVTPASQLCQHGTLWDAIQEHLGMQGKNSAGSQTWVGVIPDTSTCSKPSTIGLNKSLIDRVVRDQLIHSIGGIGNGGGTLGPQQQAAVDPIFSRLASYEKQYDFLMPLTNIKTRVGSDDHNVVTCDATTRSNAAILAPLFSKLSMASAIEREAQATQNWKRQEEQFDTLFETHFGDVTRRIGFLSRLRGLSYISNNDAMVQYTFEIYSDGKYNLSVKNNVGSNIAYPFPLQ
jgi:hypothetical protein